MGKPSFAAGADPACAGGACAAMFAAAHTAASSTRPARSGVEGMNEMPESRPTWRLNMRQSLHPLAKNSLRNEKRESGEDVRQWNGTVSAAVRVDESRHVPVIAREPRERDQIDVCGEFHPGKRLLENDFAPADDGALLEPYTV